MSFESKTELLTASKSISYYYKSIYYGVWLGFDCKLKSGLRCCLLRLGRGAHVEPKGNLQNCFSLFNFSFSLLGCLEFESHRVRVVGGVVESNLSVLLWSKPGF